MAGETYDSGKDAISYKGFPFLTHIDGTIANELSSRSGDRVRSITPFIRVTPGFTPDGNSDSRIVLEGIQASINGNPSQYEFKDLYRPELSFRPLAGITSLNVDFKNKFGSIRKATIQWICHSTDDLEQLSQYFLNPGYTLLIEWGWSKHSNVLFDLKTDKICLANYLSQVRRKIKESNGNYDAMLGIVINYNWSINRDGGFTCTTEVLSSGVLMEGITIPEQKTTEVTDGEVKTAPTSFNHYLRKIFYAQIEKDSKIYNIAKPNLDYFIYSKDTDFAEINQKVSETSQGDAAEEGDEAEFIKEHLKEHPLYLSWGYIEDKIINPNIEIKPDDASTCGGSENSNSSKKLFSYNSVGSKIGHHKYLRTTDLGICIIPEKNTGENLLNKSDSTDNSQPSIGTQSTGNISVPQYVPPKKSENSDESANSDSTIELDNFTFDNGEFENSKGFRFGYVRRILINAEFFRQTMLASTNLSDGVLNLFSKINDACGSYWDFLSVSRELEFNDSANLNNSAIETPKTEDSSTVSATQTSNITGDSGFGSNQSVLQNEKFTTTSPDATYVSYEQKNLTQKQILDADREAALNASKNGVDSIYKYAIIDANYTDNLEITPENVYIFRTRSFNLKDGATGAISRATSVIKNLNLSAKLSNASALNVFYSAQRGDNIIHGLPSSTVYHSLYKTLDSNIDNTSQEDINNPKKHVFWQNIGKEKKVSTKHDVYASGPWITPDNNESFKDGNDNTFKIAEENGFNGTELSEYHKEYHKDLKKYLPLRTYGWNAGYAIYKGVARDYSGRQGMKIVVLMDENKTDKRLKSGKSNTAVINVHCEIELEGISGIRVGDCFTIDALPTIYKERGFFQCVGVIQDISKDTWVTKIKGGYRIRRDESGNGSVNTTKPIVYTPTKPTVFNPGYSEYNGLNGKIPITDLVKIGRYNGEDKYLNRNAADAFVRLKNAAKDAGYTITVSSAYRSYDAQWAIWNKLAKQQNTSNPKGVAKPGSSNHGLGRAIDIAELYAAVGGSHSSSINVAERKKNPLYKWLAANAPSYGWREEPGLSDGVNTEELWHWVYYG